METILKLSVIAVCAAALFSSCNMDNSLELSSDASRNLVVTSISATYCPESEETKTVRQSSGSVWWSPQDEITLFFGESKSKFIATNEGTAETTNFSGYLSAVVGGGESSATGGYFLGLYPYDPEATVSAGRVTTTVNPYQVAVPDTFDNNTFVTLARSENTALSFYNLCGGFKFKVTHSGIKEIIIRGRGDENIAGEVEVAFDGNKPLVYSVIDGSREVVLRTPEGKYFETGRYYFAVILPTTFANGFTMEFICDSESGLMTRTASATIPRATFGVLSAADKTALYEPYPVPEDEISEE